MNNMTRIIKSHLECLSISKEVFIFYNSMKNWSKILTFLVMFTTKLQFIHHYQGSILDIAFYYISGMNVEEVFKTINFLKENKSVLLKWVGSDEKQLNQISFTALIKV